MVKKNDKKLLYVIILIVLALFLMNQSDIFGREVAFDDFLWEADPTVYAPAWYVSENIDNDICVPEVVYCGTQVGYRTKYHCNDSNWIVTHGELGCMTSGDRPTCSYRQTADGFLISASYTYNEACGVTFIKDLSDKDVIIEYTYNFEGGSKDMIEEYIKDIEDENIWHKTVNGQYIGTVGVRDSFSFGATSYPPNFGLPEYSGQYDRQGSTLIKSIKSRPYFNCNVEADEVVVKDSFVEGTTFSFTDLTYVPVKFCTDSYPAIKRSFTEEGVRADIYGQLTRALTRGEAVTVNLNESIEIYYIADYIEGMGERCPLDSAYDVVAGACTKIINEAADIIKIENKIELITLGPQETMIPLDIITDSFEIGGHTLSTEKPVYICANEDDQASYPNPRPGCWDITLQLLREGSSSRGLGGSPNYLYNSVDFGIAADLFELRGIPSVTYEDLTVQDDWVTNIIIKPSNSNVLEVSVISDETFFLKFNEENNINVTVRSALGSFDYSGVQVKTTTNLLFGENTEQINIRFDSDPETISVPIDTSAYGETTYEISFWYEIGNKKFFDDQKLVRSFKIVDQTPDEILVEMEQLQLDFDEKVAHIAILELEKEELAAVIEAMNLTPSESAKMIASLTHDNAAFVAMVASLKVDQSEKQAIIAAYALQTNQLKADLQTALANQQSDVPPATKTPISTPLIILGALSIIYFIRKK